jgi:8-oxo-dGTP pyrophosphatase MutT (NUDIX family)
MSTWKPNATVATVIERDGKYLLVEERDKTTGEMVFNQPAGHLEEGESLLAAACRETMEETGWEISLTGVLSVALHRAPSNGITYLRTTFVGTGVRLFEDAELDPDIHAVHWLTPDEIRAKSAKLRSPLVIDSIEQHQQGVCYPLDLIYSA